MLYSEKDLEIRLDNEGVFVSTGSETNIGIERKFYYKEAYPYSNCIVDPTSIKSSKSDLYQLILTRLGQPLYRQRYCYKMCYQIAVVNNCSCYDPEFPNTNSTDMNNITFCHDPEKLNCMTNVEAYFSDNGLTTDCSNSCPMECLSAEYKTSMHTASYPTEWYLDLLLKQTNLVNKFSNFSQNSPNLNSLIKNSVVKISIFYNDISYDALVESPVLTFDVLLGNVGGSLGLFIGISFLSLVEIFELIFEILRLIHKEGKEKKIKTKLELKASF